MNLEGLDQSVELLLISSRPLLVAHVDPDGDAVGSLLGLGSMLRSLDKCPALACQDRPHQRYDFLPGFDRITTEPRPPFDLLVSLDCSSPDRLGRIPSYADLTGTPILNIDHHVTNLNFGTVNLVQPDAVSTTQILYHLARALHIPLDEQIATCLLTGMVTDTQGFRTFNVTPAVLQIALELMEAGASLPFIVRRGLEQKSFATLRLWGAALSNLEMEDGILWTSLSVEARQAQEGDRTSSSGLSNLLINAEGVQIAVVFKEREDGQIEVGFRAAPGFNVAQVAMAFDGGGHALAAGCLVSGPLEEAQSRVLDIAREELARQRKQAAG